MFKTLGVRTTFGGSDVVSRGRRTRLWILSKVRKTWGFCSISTKDGRHGTFADDLQRRIFRGRRRTKTCSWERLGDQGADFLRAVTLWSIRNVGWLRWFCMFMREVERSGRWFPERGYILEYQKCRFAKRILRSRSTLDRWGRKIAERIGTRVWVQHWSFHFWRKFRRSGSSLMLST